MQRLKLNRVSKRRPNHPIISWCSLTRLEDMTQGQGTQQWPPVRNVPFFVVMVFWVRKYLLIFQDFQRLFIRWCDIQNVQRHCSLVRPNVSPLQWRHNDHDGVSNHQPDGCLLNRLFRRRSKKTSKLRVTGLCAGNSPVIGEFPAQRASNTENVSIWWRHHALITEHCMETSKHGNTFRNTVAFCEGNRSVNPSWIPLIKWAVMRGLMIFFMSACTSCWTKNCGFAPVIWGALASLWRHCNDKNLYLDACVDISFDYR